MKRAIKGAVLLALPSLANAELPSSVFPADATEVEKIRHCIAVDYANTMAQLVGSQIANLSSKPRDYFYGETARTNRPADWIVDAIGGVLALEDAQKLALGWEENWRSHGETYWAPIILNDGEPYNIREGRMLVVHTLACEEFKRAVAIRYGRGFYSENSQEIALPE